MHENISTQPTVHDSVHSRVNTNVRLRTHGVFHDKFFSSRKTCPCVRGHLSSFRLSSLTVGKLAYFSTSLTSKNLVCVHTGESRREKLVKENLPVCTGLYNVPFSVSNVPSSQSLNVRSLLLAGGWPMTGTESAFRMMSASRKYSGPEIIITKLFYGALHLITTVLQTIISALFIIFSPLLRKN